MIYSIIGVSFLILAVSIVIRHRFRPAHEHRYMVIYADTAFTVHGCSCGQARVFPEYNYKLTTSRYRTWLEQTLKDKGWTLA